MKILFCVSNPNLSNSGGMNKVLAYALPEFKNQKIDYLILSGNSIFNVSKGLIKVLMKNPFSYNIIIFNSLAAVSKKYNKYWKIYCYISILFKWKRVIYWHEMSSYFENFHKKNKKEADTIIRWFNKKNVLHLAVSNANSTIIDDFFEQGIKLVVYNTVNIEPQFSKNRFLYPTVLTIGSIQSIKGTDIWTKVAIDVCKKNQLIHFIWCGSTNDKELYKKCVREIKENNLEDRVQFIGYISNPIILMQSAHIYYLPSRCDSMPLVVLEAMACGKNIIYYDSGGAKEAIGNFGIYVDNFNINATSTNILSMFDKSNIEKSNAINEDLICRFQQMFSPKVFVTNLIDNLKILDF